MGEIILRGKSSAKKDYIELFIKNNNILPYNIYRFSDSLKISDSREIKRILSTRIPQGETRLLIIDCEPTVEAQNALLKTLEELPEDTTSIFTNGNLLPTVISRCRVLFLESGVSEERVSEEILASYNALLSAVEQKSFSQILILIDTLFSKSAGQTEIFTQLMVVFRRFLLESLTRRNYLKANITYKILKSLSFYNFLVLSNNLNPRIVVEKVFLANLREKISIL